MNKKSSTKKRVDLARCPKCSGYIDDSDHRCLNCGYIESPPSKDAGQSTRVDSGKIDTGDTKPASANELDPDSQAGLLICPQCRQRALFWNRHTQIYKCVNPNCRQGFTIDEYKSKEVQVSLEEPVITEPIPSDMPTIETKEKVEPVITEPILSNVPTTPAPEKVEPVITEPILSNVPTTPAPEKVEPVITEPILSNVPTTPAPEKVEPVITEPILSNVLTTPAPEKAEPVTIEPITSNVPAIETKDEVNPGIPEHKPPKVSITTMRTEGTAGTKTQKQVSRNLALLPICVLVVGLIILGVFMGQKSGRIDELSSELNDSRQALIESQTQLAASQQAAEQNVEELRTQLTEAQQEIAALQLEMYEMKPLLTPSEPYVYSGEILGGDLISIPIELKRFERVEGTISTGFYGLAVYIQDSGGSIIKDFGRTLGSKIIFTAQTLDIFTIVIKETSGFPSKYTLKYTIYQRQ